MGIAGGEGFSADAPECPPIAASNQAKQVNLALRGRVAFFRK